MTTDASVDKSAAPAKTTRGTQAISRAATLLRLIARKGAEGARLTGLSKSANLAHPTVRRILKCLIDEGLVVQSDSSPKYFLGPLNFELGLAARHDQRFTQKFGPVISRLAQESGDTAYLMARSGHDVVCLLRAEGHFPIQARTFDIGGRRPLGFGAASLALIAGLDDSEIDHILDANQQYIDLNPRLDRDRIWKRIESTRANGFAITQNIDTFGIGSVGVAIDNGDDQPLYAINITVAGADRFTKEKINELQMLIRSALARL